MDDADPRSRFLDAVAEPFPGSWDFAVFGDGSALPHGPSSFCSQARSFGRSGAYWEPGPLASSRVAARLPTRFGSSTTSIHVAELFSLLVGLRWCCSDSWNLLVFDRSSLFSVLHAAVLASLLDLSHLSCSPLVARVRHCVRRLAKAWSGSARAPAWRQHQVAFPHHWHTALPVRNKLQSLVLLVSTLKVINPALPLCGPGLWQ